MLENPLKNVTYNFSSFFQKIHRRSFEKAELSMSQTRISSEDENMEEDPVSPPPKRRLRSSGAPELSDEPSTSAEVPRIESKASDLWAKTKMFTSLDRDEHDLRGFSTMRGGIMAHKLVLGLLADGLKASEFINAMRE